MKRISFILLILISFNLFSQECPDLVAPTAGQTNVAVGTSISWEAVTGVTGYIISIGTTPNGTDIVNEQQVGSSTTFTPPLGLPDNTLIYVTITLFFFDQANIQCPSQSFTTEDVTIPPSCTAMTNPLNNAIDVAVATNINWSYVSGATGYRITIGTAPGLGDITNNLDVGNTLQYNPPVDFPDNTQIFVEIIPYNENGNATSCVEENFTTGSLGTIPACTTIISPADGEVNVALSPFIEWVPVADAIGYIVSIGSTPFDNNVLDEAVFFTNSTFVINFEPNSIYFITIIPFNAAGNAIGCGQTSFTTILGCGPYFDNVTGELVTFFPDLTLPDEVGLCLNNVPTVLIAPDMADGYRWYQENTNNVFVEISQTATVQIFEEGIYRYEAYNYTDDGMGNQIECSADMDFTVTSSETARVIGANVNEVGNGLNIEIFVEGSGDYEYALDDINGPYQDSNMFFNAPENTTIAYIRDKNGCGVVSINISIYIKSKGFPKFFTPNGDGVNDYWQYRPRNDDTFRLRVIYIFDRYGKLIKELSPNSLGWNGRFNNYEFPSSDFWYRAETTNGISFTGHFALKR